MNLSEIKQIASNLMIKRRVHLDREIGGAFYHGERVANTAIILRNKILTNDSSHDDILTVAGWFHDIGKGIEPHAGYGAVLAKEALKDRCTAAELEEIAELIALHCDRKPQNNTYSNQVKLLQDADMIDHFGTYGIWIDFLCGAFDNTSMQHAIDYNDKYLKEYTVENRKLLNYDISKVIFDEKASFVINFYERFKIESQGGICGL